ncbi:hypothetical protein SG34_032920 [Thalassomonas viridans]|uniref:Uncharacterized protein n=1 Tax=Thalassomonas viridans TaxID=137584 RepID=A0AAE9Z8H3_9GAMM|nr:hypothetical protein [Thalassomonas viridans]WDE08710.1 hypothetical protein SG34_032920 [Thalassomonas viridans]
MSELTILREFEAKRSQLASESLELCDDFNKFSDECSFLCDAFAAVARDPACITPETSEGIWYVCYKLKIQIRTYRDQIDGIHQGLRALRPNLNSEDE